MKKPKEEEIQTYMQKLGLSREEAIQLWKEDNDIEVNEEQEELDRKAKAVKIKHQASAVDKIKKSDRKPRTVSVSAEKKQLFATILENLIGNYGENTQVTKENKEISLKIGEKTFKIDVIEQRKPKK